MTTMGQNSQKTRIGVREIYRQSLKPSDSRFNLYIARPLAAPIVAILAKTSVTPNQVTFFATFIMLLALVWLAIAPGLLNLWIAVIGLELSYVFDCVDGQLARVTQQSSKIGGALDFMMDEIKAYALVIALTLRLCWYPDSTLLIDLTPEQVLIFGLMTLGLISSALTLTHFIRLPEYAEETGTKQIKNGESSGEGKAGGPLWPVKAVARIVSHYPTCIPIFAVFARMDLFLIAYAAVHLLYAAQTGLSIFIQLGVRASSTTLK